MAMNLNKMVMTNDYGGGVNSEKSEKRHYKTNSYHPDDFTGHSMSVSDVIVIEKEYEKTAYYVDSFGFTKVADFLEEKKYHSAETEQAVSRFREKTSSSLPRGRCSGRLRQQR